MFTDIYCFIVSIDVELNVTLKSVFNTSIVEVVNPHTGRAVCVHVPGTLTGVRYSEILQLYVVLYMNASDGLFQYNALKSSKYPSYCELNLTYWKWIGTGIGYELPYIL